MKRKTIDFPFLAPENRGSNEPLYRQFYETIRHAILSGRLSAGTRLPSSRSLSQELAVARLTVVNAFEQLIAEGYLETRAGSGTFVASEIPEQLLMLTPDEKAERAATADHDPVGLSEFSKRLRSARETTSRFQVSTASIPFKNGLTAAREFPFDVWEKLSNRVYRRARYSISGYGEAAGHRPLREAIAKHLSSSRGVRCGVEQVFVTNGAQQALDLVARVLLDPGDDIWIEDPCYGEAYSVFRAVGANVTPFAVDAEGFDLAATNGKSDCAKLLYITPSHQYPTGVTMSVARRLSLLDWAQKNSSWIVEDDYNSEFRYAGRPLASLQNLDETGRVIYVGTFSKTVFPALRLGCLVVPENLIDAFSEARNLCDSHSPIFEQAILADFIAEGHFGRHLRKMRMLYEKRQRCLIEEVERELQGKVEVTKSDSGMHLVGWITDGTNENEIAARAAANGLNISPLSSYCINAKLPPGLILGYTGFSEKEIKEGVKKLGQIWDV